MKKLQQIQMLLVLLLLTPVILAQNAENPPQPAAAKTVKIVGKLDLSKPTQNVILLPLDEKDQPREEDPIEIIVEPDGSFVAEVPPGNYGLQSCTCVLIRSVKLTEGESQVSLRIPGSAEQAKQDPGTYFKAEAKGTVLVPIRGFGISGSIRIDSQPGGVALKGCFDAPANVNPQEPEVAPRAQ